MSSNEIVDTREDLTLESKPLHVMKFGGTSVGGVKPIERCASLIQRYHRSADLVVVASAMRGVTDNLVNLCNLYETGDKELFDLGLEDMLYRHIQVVHELELPRSLTESLEDELVDIFSKLYGNITLTSIMTPEKYARMVSTGERSSVRILRSKLLAKGVLAEAIDASQLIETDNNFKEAKPDFERTKRYVTNGLVPLIQNGIIPVVTGFIGATKDGKVTTLGRGGSDYTASILGLVLKADEVWIWTDVDGIYSADPRYNPDAELFREVSQYRANMMAKMGARVLYTKTIEPLLGTSTVLRVKNTFNPDAEGTKIIPNLS